MRDVRDRPIAWLLPAGFVALAAWTTWSGAFVLDEWEHVHAAWKVARGEALYVDFFEHHHPPIYLLLVPLVEAWPESVSVILAARSLQLLLALGCVALVHRIGRELVGIAAGRWAAGVWLGWVPVLLTAGKVRPDTAMVLCLFAAVWFGLRATGPDPGRSAARAWAPVGASWGVALLLSSKAALFLPAVALFPFLVFLRRLRPSGAVAGAQAGGRGWIAALGATLPARLWMTAGALGPLLAGVAYLVVSGTAAGFWDWCVRFNWSFVTTLFPGTPAATGMLQVHARPVATALLLGNTGALVLAGVGGLDVARRGDRRRRTVLLGGVAATFPVLWLAGRGLYWDLSPALLFPAVLAGHGATLVLRRAVSWRRRAAGGAAPWLPATLGAVLCALLWFQPLTWVAGVEGDSRRLDRARYEHVRDRTDADDVVHQEWPAFNLHRRDASFFWFGGPALVRRAVHLGLAEPYDLRALVSRERPAFLTVLRRQEHHRWLVDEAGYRWLEELQLYERPDR